MPVRIIVHNCHMVHNTAQFWLFSLLFSRQSYWYCLMDGRGTRLCGSYFTAYIYNVMCTLLQKWGWDWGPYPLYCLQLRPSCALKSCTYAVGGWPNIVTVTSTINIISRRRKSCRQVRRRWAPSAARRSVLPSSSTRRASTGSATRPTRSGSPSSTRCRHRRPPAASARSRPTFRRGAVDRSPATETASSGLSAGGSLAPRNNTWRSETQQVH